MKTLVALLSVFLITSPAVESDNCKAYIPSQVGSMWEHTHYNAKDKVTGSNTSELKSMSEKDGEVTFEISSVIFDKKGKESMTMDFEANCKDDVFEVDMSSLFGSGVMEQYKDMEMTIDNSKLEFPDFDAAVGTELKDSEMTVKVQGMTSMNFKMVNRKLEAKESLTVSAGTFECIIITQDYEFTTMGITMRSSSKEWYAPEVGMVKSETFNKAGKLKSYSVLTKLETK